MLTIFLAIGFPDLPRFSTLTYHSEETLSRFFNSFVIRKILKTHNRSLLSAKRSSPSVRSSVIRCSMLGVKESRFKISHFVDGDFSNRRTLRWLSLSQTQFGNALAFETLFRSAWRQYPAAIQPAPINNRRYGRLPCALHNIVRRSNRRLPSGRF